MTNSTWKLHRIDEQRLPKIKADDSSRFNNCITFLPNFQVWATMRNTSAWNVAPKANLVVAALDVTSEESVDNLIKEIIKEEGDSIAL
jgi:hypothetical protein